MSRKLIMIISFYLAALNLNATYSPYPVAPQQIAPSYVYPGPVMQLQQQLFQSYFQTPNFVFHALDDGNGWQGGMRQETFPPQLQIPGMETSRFLGGIQNTNGQPNYWKNFPFPLGADIFAIEFDLVMYGQGMQNTMDMGSRFFVFINDNIISEENIYTLQYNIPLKYGVADPGRGNNTVGRVYHYKLVFLKDPKSGFYDLLDRNGLRTGPFIMPTMVNPANPSQNPGQLPANIMKIGFGVQSSVGNIQFGISDFGISTQLQ